MNATRFRVLDQPLSDLPVLIEIPQRARQRGGGGVDPGADHEVEDLHDLAVVDLLPAHRHVRQCADDVVARVRPTRVDELMRTVVSSP